MEDRAQRFKIDAYAGQDLQLWQGTILRTSVREAVSAHKLVVSADCDLLNDKGAGEFFCLDVIEASPFLSRIAYSDIQNELIGVVVNLAREVAEAKEPRFSDVSDDVLREWLAASDSARFKRDLPLNHANDIDLLVSLSENLRAVTTFNGESSSLSALLAKSDNGQLKGRIDKLNKQLSKVCESRIQASRADLYVLPEIPGAAAVGHFVPFRSLKLLERSSVCERLQDLKHSPGSYVPVGVCKPMLLQSLLQKLTLYFTRIGLTNTFKSEQEHVVKKVMESFA